MKHLTVKTNTDGSVDEVEVKKAINVIHSVNELPTATADSPDFVQTPDGTLYRKKAVESGGLLGTWVLDKVSGTMRTYENDITVNVSFSSNGNNYTSIKFTGMQYPNLSENSKVTIMDYGNTTVFDGSGGGWVNTAYQTINITDISSLTNVDEFTQWLTANATGGGASVTYEYVALQDNSKNVVIDQTVSAPSAGITYIQCTLSGTISAAGNYYFVNCSGSITVSGTFAKVYVTDSHSLTISGITSNNWRNVFIDGRAQYKARTASINLPSGYAGGYTTVATNVNVGDEVEICFRLYQTSQKLYRFRVIEASFNFAVFVPLGTISSDGEGTGNYAHVIHIKYENNTLSAGMVYYGQFSQALSGYSDFACAWVILYKEVNSN